MMISTSRTQPSMPAYSQGHVHLQTANKTTQKCIIHIYICYLYFSSTHKQLWKCFPPHAYKILIKYILECESLGELLIKCGQAPTVPISHVPICGGCVFSSLISPEEEITARSCTLIELSTY